MVAIRIGGDVKRVIVASPRYLAQHPRIDEPGDLAKHRIVTSRISGAMPGSSRPQRAAPSPGRSSSSRGWSSTACARRSAQRSAVSASPGFSPITWPSASMMARCELLLRDTEPPARPVNLLLPQGRSVGSQGARLRGFCGPPPARGIRQAVRRGHGAEILTPILRAKEECLPDDGHSVASRYNPK